MAVDATNKFAVTTGQDKRINIWNLMSGKHVRAYKPTVRQSISNTRLIASKLSTQNITGELYKADTDPSSTFVATCSFDKRVRVFDFFSGEAIDEVGGHSELVTAVRFSPDGEWLISVGGDGCIFIWKLDASLVQASVSGRRARLHLAIT
jgi:WD40 repeat protein